MTKVQLANKIVQPRTHTSWKQLQTKIRQREVEKRKVQQLFSRDSRVIVIVLIRQKLRRKKKESRMEFVLSSKI